MAMYFDLVLMLTMRDRLLTVLKILDAANCRNSMNMLQRRVKGRKEGGKAQRKVALECVLNLGRIGWEGWKGGTFCLWKIGEGLWMD